LIFNEKIIQYSKKIAPQVQTPWNKAHAPFSLRELSKDTKNTKTSWFGGLDLITSKQNNLPS
jgi:hypothetical protein